MNFPSVRIEVFDSYIRFLNPGTMLISIDDFFSGGNSKPRNEIIMKFFRLLGESERQGFGGTQILNSAIQSKFRMPEIYSNLESTELKLWYIDLAQSYPGLTDDQKKVLDFISCSSVSVSKREIENNLNLSEHRSRIAIEGLTDKGIVQMEGKGSASKYNIKTGEFS